MRVPRRKPDEIAFLQVSDSYTAVPKLRTTPLTWGNGEVVRAAVPLMPTPQVRGLYHRNPYGVASSWYAATWEAGAPANSPSRSESTASSVGIASSTRHLEYAQV
jgi:hypothetical protein